MKKLSITGADNLVDTHFLAKMVEKYPFLELAILLFPEKENAPRNPGVSWRNDFLKLIPKDNTAIHLCGIEVFEQILSSKFCGGELFKELKSYGRLQININARNDKFDIESIHKVYNTLLSYDFNLILQYHSRGESWVLPFLDEFDTSKGGNIEILLDASLGKGVAPEKFVIPSTLLKYPYTLGFAGGINPENIKFVHEQVKLLSLKRYWLDLETGCRTDNVFDLKKAELLCKYFFDLN